MSKITVPQPKFQGVYPLKVFVQTPEGIQTEDKLNDRARQRYIQPKTNTGTPAKAFIAPSGQSFLAIDDQHGNDATLLREEFYHLEGQAKPRPEFTQAVQELFTRFSQRALAPILGVAFEPLQPSQRPQAISVAVENTDGETQASLLSLLSVLFPIKAEPAAAQQEAAEPQVAAEPQAMAEPQVAPAPEETPSPAEASAPVEVPSQEQV